MADNHDDPLAGLSDALTELQQGAAQMHEVFSAHVEAGFTEAQAMQIVVAFIAASRQ